jgi:diadenosine tetraphosphate (Ap4A) HIT family hydrolase
MTDCPFCAVVSGQAPVLGGVICEDNLILARHNDDGDAPYYLGSIIVQTKRHNEGGVAEISDEEAQAAGLLVTRVGRALKACLGAEKVYAYTFGEAFPHLHTFVVARYRDTPPAYWRLGVADWPDAPRGGADEIATLAGRLRAELQRLA